MHIVIVTRNLSAGGAERVISQLVNSWTSMEVTCSLILLEKKNKFYTLSNKVNIYEIGNLSINRCIDKLKKYLYVRKLVLKLSPNVVLSLPEEIGIYVIMAMLGTSVPVVVSERNDPWLMPYKKITRLFRFLMYPFAVGLIFQTLQASFFFSKKIRKKSIILANPLDLSCIPDFYYGERRKIIVGVGRLEKQKNFNLLIDAFSEIYKSYPDYRLLIYGDGSLKETLREYAFKKIPNEHTVYFAGVSHDLLNEIKDASIFVLSSDYEGLPNVLIEAMSVGIPVVSVDCEPGGAAELVKNGENGILVPTKDVQKMVDGIKYLIDNPKMARLYSVEAANIRNKLDIQVVSRQWLRYIINCAKK